MLVIVLDCNPRFDDEHEHHFIEHEHDFLAVRPNCTNSICVVEGFSRSATHTLSLLIPMLAKVGMIDVLGIWTLLIHRGGLELDRA